MTLSSPRCSHSFAIQFPYFLTDMRARLSSTTQLSTLKLNDANLG